MENQHMETSHNKAWKCGNLHMYLFWIRLRDWMGYIFQSHKSFTHALESTILNKAQPHHSHKCAIIEKYGNIEVGIERMGGDMGHEK